MADCKIRNVYTGIAGSHIRSFNSSGMVAIKDKEVTAMDVSRVIETAKAVNIPTDQQLLHTLPQEFIVDSQDDVRGTDWYERYPFGSESAYRHGCGIGRAKYCEVRASLRFGSV